MDFQSLKNDGRTCLNMLSPKAMNLLLQQFSGFRLFITNICKGLQGMFLQFGHKTRGQRRILGNKARWCSISFQRCWTGIRCSFRQKQQRPFSPMDVTCVQVTDCISKMDVGAIRKALLLRRVIYKINIFLNKYNFKVMT